LLPEQPTFFYQRVVVVEEAIPSLLAGLVGYLMVEVKVVAGGLI
jgi:hypothetical protein